MLFSEQNAIVPTAEDDWFDPLLTQDTQLGIDPFQIYYAADDPDWAGAHDRLIDFFNLVFELVAKSHFDHTSAHWRAAERLMTFPEPPEYCLGFAETSTRGSGTGGHMRTGMMDGVESCIRIGLTSLAHFEELTLFHENIGADRISDIVGNVLKDRFVAYTQSVCSRHGVPLARQAVTHLHWDRQTTRWRDDLADLPVNPYARTAVVLVPERFLRRLPSVQPDEFWRYAWTNHNEELRSEFNLEIGRKVDAREIVRLARQRPDLAASYVTGLETNPKPPYDFSADPAWVRRWYPEGAAWANTLEDLPEPTTEDQFATWIEDILAAFVQCIENYGWRLLWQGGKPAPERTVQLLFQAIAVQHCRFRGIDISPESNAGRGPVDFKFSQGWQRRALVEIKLANNTQFWHGLRTQLPTYLRAEEVHYGHFLVVAYRPQDLDRERQAAVREAASAVSEAIGRTVEVTWVDAQPQRSASIATPKREDNQDAEGAGPTEGGNGTQEEHGEQREADAGLAAPPVE